MIRSNTKLRYLKEDGRTAAAYYGEEYHPPNVSLDPYPVDPSKPWKGSPKSQLFPLTFKNDPRDIIKWPNRVVPDMKPWKAHGFVHRRGTVRREKVFSMRSPRLSISYWKGIIQLYWDKRAWKRVEKDWNGSHGVKRVPLPVDWKEYGYWARPHFEFNGTSNRLLNHVPNSTPPSRNIELEPEDVEAVVKLLYDADGTFHPSRWIPRAEHPMLPKRPDLWPTPNPSLTNLTYNLPSELILNPSLEHRRVGRPPMLFDVRRELEDILIAGHEGHNWNNYLLGVNSSNAYQPATYPSVTAMTITVLADDTRLSFDWKFTVLPHHPKLPVMVIDVLHAIKENFDQCISLEELRTIVGERVQQMWHAFERRTRFFKLPRIGGIKRVDYLVDNYYFRGLEPAPDGEGWMIFFGGP